MLESGMKVTYKDYYKYQAAETDSLMLGNTYDHSSNFLKQTI